MQPRLHWPDRPLEFYDDRQLQDFFLQPFKVDRAFKTDGLAASGSKTFPVPNRIRDAEILIRGGRWLITATEQGEVLYFDLEAPAIRPQTLITASERTTTDVLPSIAVDMDDDAPYITFNLAVVPDPFSFDVSDSDLRPIQVWRVTGVPDDRGHVVDLTAEKLVSFYDREKSMLSSLSIRGNLLAFSLQFDPIVVIIDWTRVEQPGAQVRQMIGVECYKVGKHFLNRLLVF